MGWGSGSQLAEDMWKRIRTLIPAKNRGTAAEIIWQCFEDHDCDTLDECDQLIKDIERTKE
jgi:hypothetical protein